MINHVSKKGWFLWNSQKDYSAFLAGVGAVAHLQKRKN